MAGEVTRAYPMALDRYGAVGWRGVLPLPPRAKMPPPRRFTGGEGVWPSRADQFDFDANAPADCNVGLRLPDNVIGLDVDHYGDKHGWDALLDFKLSPLPATWRSSAREAPSGIYFYRVPAGTRLRGQAASAVEVIQTHHRFAVVWPSVHPTEGPYLWWTPAGELASSVPSPDELPDLPPDWLEALAEVNPEALQRERPEVSYGNPALALDNWSPAVRQAAEKAAYELRHGAKGARHETASYWTMCLCRLEAEGAEGATAALNAYGDTFIELMAEERGGGSVAAAEYARLVIGGRSLAATTTTRALEAARSEQEALADLVPAARGFVKEVDFSHHFLSFPELYADDTGEADYLCAPLLARGRGHALFAPAKAGKSLLMLEVAAALATGRPCLEQEAAEPMHVVYFDHEMSRDDVRERLQDLGYADPSELERLHYALLPSLPPLDTDAGGREVADICEHYGAALAVFDTTSRVVAGAENEADTFRAFFRYTGARLKRLGVTYVRLDHAGKELDKGQRGSSAKADDVDVVWQLTASDDGSVKLKATHRRMGWLPAEVHLQRLSDPLRHTMSERGYLPGTKALADELDALGLPTEVGRERAREWLAERGFKGYRSNRLADALRYRKVRSEDISGPFVGQKPVPEASGTGQREQLWGTGSQDAA